MYRLFSVRRPSSVVSSPILQLQLILNSFQSLQDYLYTIPGFCVCSRQSLLIFKCQSKSVELYAKKQLFSVLQTVVIFFYRVLISHNFRYSDEVILIMRCLENGLRSLVKFRSVKSQICGKNQTYQLPVSFILYKWQYLRTRCPLQTAAVAKATSAQNAAARIHAAAGR